MRLARHRRRIVLLHLVRVVDVTRRPLEHARRARELVHGARRGGLAVLVLGGRDEDDGRAVDAHSPFVHGLDRLDAVDGAQQTKLRRLVRGQVNGYELECHGVSYASVHVNARPSLFRDSYSRHSTRTSDTPGWRRLMKST